MRKAIYTAREAFKGFFVKVYDAITTPFASFAVGLDESRRINDNGTWDKYWTRKNKTRP